MESVETKETPEAKKLAACVPGSRTPYYSDDALALYHGDALEVLCELPDASVQCCVTSPPYWGLRDYKAEGQLGLERTPDEYVERMVAVFRVVRRVLKPDGVLWLNLGDSYAAERGGTHQPAESLAGGVSGQMPDGERVNRDRRDGYCPSRNASAIGLKHKDLVGIPWRVAFALQADGWYLRQDIIWHKPNPMPESVRDRCTKAHEYIFMLTKAARYYYDADAVAEPAAVGDNGSSFVSPYDIETKPALGMGERVRCVAGGTRNKRDVWTVATQPFSEAHFATFPPEIPQTCILASSRPGDTVLDPFNGAGTTGMVAQQLGRKYIGIDLNTEYLDMSIRRTAQGVLALECCE